MAIFVWQFLYFISIVSLKEKLEKLTRNFEKCGKKKTKFMS